MRTTLNIDDDVLLAARALAERQNTSLGEVISALSRQALQPARREGGSRNGITLLPAKPSGLPVTLERVNQLRDDAP